MAHFPQKNILIISVMTAWLASAVIFAGIFIIEKHIHDHTGDNCRICLEIQIAQRIIEALGRLGAGLFFAGFIKRAAPLIKPRLSFFEKKPTALKVKFNC